MKKEASLVPLELVERKIYLIRGMKVMLDSDLAELYQVKTRTLNQAVKRNMERFPSDFMFQLNTKEISAVLRSRSQIVTLKRGQNIKYLPYAFTEQGVAMLSAVLKSERAVQMSIIIVRAFIKLREMLATHKNLVREFEKMKKTQKNHGQHIVNILNVISQLLTPPTEPPKEPISFKPKN